MIEHTDITILGTTTLKNKLGITDPEQLATAEADFTAFRLAELRIAPIPGGFDSVHLQQIHHHVYQDLHDWAGELRRVDADNRPASDVATALNAIFDRLARENHLKGRAPKNGRMASLHTFMNLEQSGRFSLAMKSLCVSLPMSWHVRTISASNGRLLQRSARTT